MGIVVLLCLAPSAAAVVVGALRARPRALPEPYVQYRPHLHPHVVLAELEVRQAYRDLAPLYETPTLSGPPAR
ncbi:hypothetical protein OH809_45235 (plasmid) [Streptomyces sp. NBC_00873]|uniref:hypothetical protein n=1 Tax=Streptomyces sp. NBC_00873 TaxID=2975852 RepID=UPI0037DC3AD5|nr:hypothetical protein OH809_45235 [Streptomyces sp. NBC_00873]